MLSIEERKKIRTVLGKELTPLEEAIFDVAWSEHCSYKSSKKYLRELSYRNNRVVQGPGENAGVVKIDDNHVAAFKVESHNHPSQIEPFNGAATGIGGIVRDILAMGTRPYLLLDSLRFGDIEEKTTQHIAEGVVSGISHYGNCIGVPTVSGETLFDDVYADNCLVNVVCLGIGNKQSLKKALLAGEGNSIILAGARTGRDGIKGASFASIDLNEGEEDKRNSVQIGDPFMEKLLIEATMELINDPDLLGLQDLGAGGLATAVSEMALKGKSGAEIDLSLVPLREQGMSPAEIIVSESQERMIFCVKKGSEDRFLKTFGKWGLMGSIIGTVTSDNLLRIKWQNRTLAELPVDFIVSGFDEQELEQRKPAYIDELKYKTIPLLTDGVKSKDIYRLLGQENINSKAWVYEQYDYMVGINTVHGPSAFDAALLRIKGSRKSIAVNVSGNGRLVYLDPFYGVQNTVCHALEALLSVGAYPIAMTDGLNFASPLDKEVYYTFSSVVEGLKNIAEYLDIPVISGNVSFYNQSNRRKIYPTPIIGMLGVRDTPSQRLHTGFGNDQPIYLVGKEFGEIGGSEFLHVFYDFVGGEVDVCDLFLEKKLIKFMVEAFGNNLIYHARNVGKGGLVTALVKSSIAGGIGLSADVDTDEATLMGEWQQRFIVTPYDTEAFEELAMQYNIPYRIIGKTGGESLLFRNFSLSMEKLKNVYNNSLRNLLEA